MTTFIFKVIYCFIIFKVIGYWLATTDRKMWPVPWLNFADAYETIQMAIDAYGEGNFVYFPPGEYHINEPLRITKDNTTLYGQEDNKTYFDDTFMEVDNCRCVLIEGLHAESYQFGGTGIKLGGISDIKR